MKIIVDTSIWSLAFRRKNDLQNPNVLELYELIQESRVQIIGSIRQEILSGIRSKDIFIRLKKRLSAFPDLLITSNDYEKAAEYFNVCKSKGIQGSNTDYLICAISNRFDFSIFTNDKDFQNFEQLLPIKLHSYRVQSL